MIDIGLAVSLVVTAALVWSAGRVWRRSALLDAALTGLLVGIAAARVARVAIEHPAGLLSPMELVSVRSGAELWVGVAAGVLWWWWRSEARGRDARTAALAATAPLVLVGHGAFSATCVVRDGCPGPPSAVGLVPEGLSTRVLPLGLAVGVVMVGVAVLLVRSSWSPRRVVATSIAAVAVTRALSTWWGPRLTTWGPSEVADVVIATVAIALAAASGSQESPPATSG